ncbi:6PGL phosphogluconolactonase, partial [Crotophaga sulcirostris]|nr:6PGL phosphogluconolactonase [Crotophaga sulcirostris]
AALAREVLERAEAAAGGTGRFSLGLSGGSLVDILAGALPAAMAEAGAEASRWLLALCDERL